MITIFRVQLMPWGDASWQSNNKKLHSMNVYLGHKVQSRQCKKRKKNKHCAINSCLCVILLDLRTWMQHKARCSLSVFRLSTHFQSPPQVLEQIEYLEKTIGIPIFSRIYVCIRITLRPPHCHTLVSTKQIYFNRPLLKMFF